VYIHPVINVSDSLLSQQSEHKWYLLQHFSAVSHHTYLWTNRKRWVQLTTEHNETLKILNVNTYCNWGIRKTTFVTA
jgi:hypothetical protein